MLTLVPDSINFQDRFYPILDDVAFLAPENARLNVINALHMYFRSGSMLSRISIVFSYLQLIVSATPNHPGVGPRRREEMKI